MGFRKRGIDLQGFVSRGAHGRHRLMRRIASENHDGYPIVSESNMREGESVVQQNRLFVTLPCQIQRFRRHLGSKMPRLEVNLIGSEVRRISMLSSPIGELYLQGSNDRGRYLVLYHKNVAHLSIVSLRP